MGDEKQTTTTPPNDAVVSLANMPLEGAFDQTKTEADALTEDQLDVINIDVAQAIIAAIGIWPRIQAYFPTIEAQLGHAANLQRIKDLPRYTSALSQAQRLYVTAYEPVAPIKEWADELSKTHDIYFSNAESLAKHGLIEAEVLPNVRSHVSYKVLGFNVLNLVQLYRSRWTKIAGRTPITEEDLTKTEAFAQRLINAIAEQEYRTSQQSIVQALRRRYFTLFARAYGEARRAVIFLRWFEGDADKYTPSLWEGRGGSKKKDEKSEKTDGSDNADKSDKSDKGETSGQPQPNAGGATPTPQPVAPTGGANGGPTNNPFGREHA